MDVIRSLRQLKNTIRYRILARRPKSYSKYLKLQVLKYLSHESDSATWSEGQKRYILREFEGIKRTSKILDVSCGDGVGLRVFKELGFSSVTGFEYCHEKVMLAKGYGYNVLQGDFHGLSAFSANTFDIVYSSHSLEHALYPSKVLAEFLRVLKPNGLLKLVLPYPDRGPIDAHVAKIELGSDLNDNATSLLAYLKNNGVNVTSYSFDDFREDEVWITALK